VPRDLELSGNEETFTATVTFDTKNVFGKLDAICQIKLKSRQEKKDEGKARESALPDGAPRDQPAAP
jgi:hypothetical protein